MFSTFYWVGGWIIDLSLSIAGLFHVKHRRIWTIHCGFTKKQILVCCADSLNYAKKISKLFLLSESTRAVKRSVLIAMFHVKH